MVSRDDRAEETMGTNPCRGNRPVAAVTGPATNLAVAPEAPEGLGIPLLGDPADTDDEKAHQDTFQLIMQGFHATTHTLSDEYQEACKEVQTIIRRSLRKSTAIDRTFVWGALVGEGCASGHGLHGEELGGAVTPTAGSPSGWERSHGGLTSLTP